MGVGGSGPLPTSGGTELERIRSIVAAYFPVYETRVGPQSLLLAVHVDRASLSEKFDRLRQELWTLGYIPLLRRHAGEEFVEVVRRPKSGRTRLWINLLLLAGTVATTVFAGSLIWLTYVGATSLGPTDFLWGGVYFAAPVMTILGLHELAHYLAARRYRVDASLPYFIPVPPPFLFGTLGAFVSIRQPFPDRKALFDIGVAGPIVGFLASVPIALVGLYLSAHAPALAASYCGPTILGQSYGNLEIGEPLFWGLFSLFFPAGSGNLHPLALAGWVGIFVTAINLLPAGQLDGGHVFRALFGNRARFVSYGVVILLFGLGLFYTGWLFFAFLVLFLGFRHPPPLNDLSPLGGARYGVGALALLLLVAGFVVVPLAVPPGNVAFQGASSAIPVTLPPGAAVAANLTVTLVNGDQFPHAYDLRASVTNVTVAGPNGTIGYLTGSALASWAANSTWRLFLPGGSVFVLSGGSVSLPNPDALTLNSTGNYRALIQMSFSNSESARAAVLSLSVSQLCAPGGSGSTTQTFAPVFT